MSQFVSIERPIPDITSIESPHSSTHGKRHAYKSGSFPSAYRLIVTTTRGVYAWDVNGVTELFHSGSEGIVAARKLSGPGEMLAVADSQVVVLHDINKGMQKSYRLKGSEGQVRLLKYAGDSSQSLFFTTSLRNSVQSFSLKSSKILDPADSHPSPPSVFALSCTAHLLLSASSTPPTIYLRNLRAHDSPQLVRPRCSVSAVVAASFHPESENLFMLAFADGSAAAFDASLLTSKYEVGGSTRLQGSCGAGGEIGHVERLHAIGSRVKKRTIDDGDWIDDPNGNNVTAEATSITAVALVPGHKAMAVTVGADGKCCVIDFTQPTRKKAVLLKSWHLRRPATSLSVVYSRSAPSLPQLDGVADYGVPANKDYCIAVGRQDGKVLLFDLGGKPLGKQVLDPNGARVVDVEWARREIGAAFAENEQLMPSPWKSVHKRGSLGTEVLNRKPVADGLHGQPDYTKQDRDPLFDDWKASHVATKAVEAVNHLDLPSIRGPHAYRFSPTAEAAYHQDADAGDVAMSSRISTHDTSMMVEPSNSPPPVPSRPSPKPGGNLSMRRAETARNVQLSPGDFDSKSPPLQRRSTSDTVTPTKIPIPKTSPAKMTLFGPRSPLSKTKEGINERPARQANLFHPTARLREAQISDTSRKDESDSLPKPGLVAKYDRSPTSTKLLRPLTSPLPKRLQEKTSTPSLLSYKTASSRMDLSENSADTVVDWSASASSRRLDPSIHELTPDRLPNPHSFFHQRPQNEKTKKDESKDKREATESFNASPHSSLASQFSDTHRSEVSDTVVHWPSLRKSPFIADLGTAIESATASVLDLGIYTDDPTSPTKAQKGENSTPHHPPKPANLQSSSNKNNRFIPPRLPLKVSPQATHSPYDPSTHTCPCEPHLEAVITDAFVSFRVEMQQGFKAQRLWLEDLVRGREEGRQKLEDENRVLREELGRARGKGKAGSG